MLPAYRLGLERECAFLAVHADSPHARAYMTARIGSAHPYYRMESRAAFFLNKIPQMPRNATEFIMLPKDEPSTRECIAQHLGNRFMFLTKSSDIYKENNALELVWISSKVNLVDVAKVVHQVNHRGAYIVVIIQKS